MKRNLKKLFSAALILSMILSLAACGGSKNDSAKTDSSTELTQPESTTGQESTTSTLPIVKDKLTLKFVCYNWGDAVYGNDMAVFKELEKRTNISLDWQLLPAEDNLTKLSLIMASGELPDMISYGDVDAKKTYDKYGIQGAIIPLDDLIDQNAPNIKALLNNPPYEIPNLKAESKGSDGKIYSLPTLTQIHTGQIFAIRQDWLDKVGMKVPETTEDLYNVLKAFKEKDPNGNGKQDEIGFSPDEGLPDLTTLMNAFGAHESFYADTKDNTIKYGPLEANYKEGLEYCNKLYTEELINKTYINKNTEDFRANVAKNLVGMIYAWPLSGLGFCNTAVSKLNPTYKYVAMLPLKGPHGDRFKERPQQMINPRTVITSSNKHPVETIKYLDYVFSKEGNILMNYGVEGKDYTLDTDGNPKFTDFVLKNPEGKDPATVRISEGMQVGLPYIATFESESQTATDNNIKDAWKLYTENDVLYPNFPNVPLNETQIGDINGILTDLKTFVDENSDKFIMGRTSLADFDKFVSTIESMGIEEVLKTYNEAYQKYVEYNK